jgi:hypothetical protein
MATFELGDGFQSAYSDVEWLSSADENELIIHVDESERVTRLASELRACGLMVSIATEDESETVS